MYDERLAAVSPLRNTDLHPRLYLHASLEWLAVTSPGAARVTGWLVRAVGARWWLAALGVLLFAAAWGLIRRRGGAPGFAVGAAGFSGLALELGLLVAAQELRGVVYHEIAILLASFMVGVSFGSALGGRLVARTPRWALSAGLAGVSAAALVSAGTLYVAVAAPAMALPLLLAAMVAVGAAVGTCYPAAADRFAWRRATAAPAHAYAWDMAGAAAGAVLSSVLLLTVLGLTGTCWLAAALCAGAAATAVAGRSTGSAEPR
jgi:hypothetical protein